MIGAGRAGGVRLRWHDGRLLLRHHAHRVDREPEPEARDLYDLLQQAQAEAVAAARVGTTCEAVDTTARSVSASGGYGDAFIHRTGHGIGLEAHEDPYIVAGNTSRSRLVMPFRWSPGSTCPDGLEPASRTS